MRTLLIGIDSGTQSTKVLVVDAKNGKVLSSASRAYDLIPNLPPGREGNSIRTLARCRRPGHETGAQASEGQRAEVQAIGISGQQHGFRPARQAWRGHPSGQALVR